MNPWTILLILMVGVLLCWTLAPRLYARYRDWHHDRYEHEHKPLLAKRCPHGDFNDKVCEFCNPDKTRE